MKFIGITGGIGAGKSEILSYIKNHYKCEIYLADEVAHEVKKAGTKCFEKLVCLLGEDVVGTDGEINKAVMAEKIFNDASLLEKVNAIIHPAVKDFLLAKYHIANANGVVELFFVEAALLIETGYKAIVDEMWYVYAREEVRVNRLKSARGYSDEKIQLIMNNQLSEQEFRNSSDFVIDNSDSLQSSYEQIDKKLEAYTWQE